MNDILKMREKDVVTGIVILIVLNFLLGFIVAQNWITTSMKPRVAESGIVVEIFGDDYFYEREGE